MPKFMIRFVALLLIPCLVADPARATGGIARKPILPNGLAWFLPEALGAEPVLSPLQNLLHSLPKIRGICNQLAEPYRPFQATWSGENGQRLAKALIRINAEIYQAMRKRDNRSSHLEAAHQELKKFLQDMAGITVSEDDPGARLIQETLVGISKILADPNLANDRPTIKKIHQRIYQLFDLNIVKPITLLGVADRPAIGPVAAEILYNAIRDEVQSKGWCNIILPADRTVEGTYKEFARMLRDKPIDLSRVHFFFLDNYLNIPQRFLSRDFRAQAMRDLIRPLSQLNRSHPGLRFDPEKVHTMGHADRYFSGKAEHYDPLIDELGGIDMALIGIGLNSHMAFMEPIVSFFIMLAKKIRVSPGSRKQNAELFDNDYRNVPKYALSAGIGTILASKKIVQLIATPSKQTAMLRALEWVLSEWSPSSALRTHGNVTIIADKEARAKLHPERFAQRYRLEVRSEIPTPEVPKPKGRRLGPVQGLVFGWKGTLFDEGVLLPGVAGKLRNIRKQFPDLPIYISSEESQETIHHALEISGIKDLFTEVLGGRRPQEALHALKMANLWDENDLLVVGSLREEMKAAAGQRMVGVVNSLSTMKNLHLENASHFIATFEDLEFQPTFQFNVVNVFIPEVGPVFAEEFIIRSDTGEGAAEAQSHNMRDSGILDAIPELTQWLEANPITRIPFRLWASSLRLWRDQWTAYNLDIDDMCREIFAWELFSRLETEQKEFIENLFIREWSAYFQIPAKEFKEAEYFPFLLMDFLRGFYTPKSMICCLNFKSRQFKV